MTWRWMLMGTLAAAGFAACIDLEGAHRRCEQDGRCANDAGVTPPQDAGTDAGTEDAGADAGVEDAGHDAGLEDAGHDAGQDAGEPYDGGTPCASSANPRLRCAAPIPVVTGEAVGFAAMTVAEGAFLVAYPKGTAVELVRVHLDGGLEPVQSVPSGSGASVELAGSGDGWALAYVSGTASAITCLTSAEPQGISVPVADGGTMNAVSVALSPDGGVSLGALDTNRHTHVFAGHSGSGCPAALQRLTDFTYGNNSIATVHTSAGVGLGFRYVISSQANASIGNVDVVSLGQDGATAGVFFGASDCCPENQAPQFMTAAASAGGERVFALYDQVQFDGVYTLGYLVTSADLAGDGTPAKVGDDPGSWEASHCGPGCAAAVFTDYDQARPATVIFFDDEQSTVRGRYDAICSFPAAMNGNGVRMRWVGGKLGVLQSSPTAIRLYLCDVPPL